MLCFALVIFKVFKVLVIVITFNLDLSLLIKADPFLNESPLHIFISNFFVERKCRAL